MELLKSFDKTKLDLENPAPSTLNRLDTITNFNPNNTGTPTNVANPGAPSRFFQKFIPQETYLQHIKNLPSKSNLLNLSATEQLNKYTIFDATNLDTERSGVNGGIPYKQDKDPTVYPTTTQARSSTTGTSSLPGQGASKFNQSFSPTKTYSDFIKKFA